MELLIGMFGAVIGIGLFVAGFVLGTKLAQPKKLTVSQEEIEEQAKERERLLEDQSAFKDLLGYNTDIAYRIDSSRKA